MLKPLGLLCPWVVSLLFAAFENDRAATTLAALPLWLSCRWFRVQLRRRRQSVLTTTKKMWIHYFQASSSGKLLILRLPFRYNPNCVQWWNFNLARYTQQARVRFIGFSSNECKIKRDISTSCRIVLGNLNITQVLSLSKIAERSFRFTQLNMKIIRSTSRRKL